MKYLKLLPLFFLSLIFFTTNADAQSVESVPGEVSVIRAKLMTNNGALMVDVREQSEVDALAYDVENLLHIPMSEMATRMDEIPTDRELIIVCRSGNRSRRVMDMLLENDYTTVSNMVGGMNAWQQRDLGVVSNGEVAPKASCAPKSETATKSCCASKAKGASSCASSRNKSN